MHSEMNTVRELQTMIFEYKAQEVDSRLQDQLLKDIIIKYVDLSKELDKKIQEVFYLSITDPLTKAFNRIKFNEAIHSEINRAKRYKKIFSIIMLDIDYFKKINDTYGHDVGDKTLMNLTKIVKNIIRTSDTFARWGGEEFILLVPETSARQAMKLAEKIRLAIQASRFDPVEKVTCSFGVSEFDESDDMSSITKRVDEALYEAKLKGRNRVALKNAQSVR